MLGLKRGTVNLVSYKKEWVNEFEKEKKNLERILGDTIISIEHCGSTAIPGLKAKPIIDVLVGVKTVKKEGEYCNAKLDRVKGYYSRNKYFPKKDRFVVAKGNAKVRTHYIHIVRYKGGIWNKLLRFRDYLKKDKKAMTQYLVLKEKLSLAHPDERRLYTKKKSDFIKKVLK
jgi:GrpB-like predicted nucleotidyltransferase (UPF0157 family)